MDWERPGPKVSNCVRDILGYLNFSSGASDTAFLRSVNEVFRAIAASRQPADPPAWKLFRRLLEQGLSVLRGSSEAFRQADQAEAVLHLVFDGVLPEYRRFHRDLLFHQTEEFLFQPFFLGRVFEAVLAEGPPWDETPRIVPGAIGRLNDFVGYRPVAVLRTREKMQPYAHEWVRPIPLYIRGAGVATGLYEEVVQQALDILASTPQELLERAWFRLERLEELALDPRAYDFEHPVNRRPNYHFGCWDPHRIDPRGYYCRYVLQQVTLDALSQRVQKEQKLAREELLFEAGAVLAGTMLMGAGITGASPHTHDSSVTLATLLPHIAAYRDAFYEDLLKRVGGEHGQRLRAEAKALHQPFGGARQHLNQTLARCRALQVQRVGLARLFARMGYADAAREQAARVAVASARMRCEIDCRITAAHQAIDNGRLEQAAALLPEIEDILHRAIECGAMVDPWNILGFGGQFAKFPAVEDSIHDPRVDELLELMHELFALYGRLEEAAAASGEDALVERLSAGLRGLADWWDQFATTEIRGLESISGRQAWESARQVATALGAWHRAGTEAGKIAFWRQHAEHFRTPKAYSLLVEALLQQRDRLAAMALLMHWLSQAEEVPLAQGPHSFHELAERWMADLWAEDAPARAGHLSAPPLSERCALARKFLDYLEANAEAYWDVPRLELPGSGLDGGVPAPTGTEDEGEAENSENIFRAAYEDVIYRDSADDGFEGEMLEGRIEGTDVELAAETDRITRRLSFLLTVIRLWNMVAWATRSQPDAAREESLAGWLNHIARWQAQFAELLRAVHAYRIPPSRGSFESLVEYDRRRLIKDLLLERIITVSVETSVAGLMLEVLRQKPEGKGAGETWEAPVCEALRAALRGDTAGLRKLWPALENSLLGQPLLYHPVARGGDPQHIARCRIMQQVLRRLLVGLPRLGLIAETGQLLATIQKMERKHPVGPGAVTEFDDLFDIACRGIYHCLVESSADWPAQSDKRGPASELRDKMLLEVLERATEGLVHRWVAHSRHVRLSVLELVDDPGAWSALKQFIRRYGDDLFTQKFMGLSNLRAILHQGVDRWLRACEEEPEEHHFRLLKDLDRRISRTDAVRHLELVIEAVLENYNEYIDYNSTTTQSDRGEMLYTLLDFLRLEASYNRVAWNLRPAVLAHEVLVRTGRHRAAQVWRIMFSQRCESLAAEHQQRLDDLVAKYAMRLPSIAERIGERFVRPLLVARLRALVREAVAPVPRAKHRRAFDRLLRGIETLACEPSGGGFDAPEWLTSLEEEVEAARGANRRESAAELEKLPQVRLTRAQAERQVRALLESA